MKIHCKVTGHELIEKVGGNQVKVKLKGVGQSGLKVEMIVAEEERVKYPFGCSAVVDFNVQQSLPLEK